MAGMKDFLSGIERTIPIGLLVRKIASNLDSISVWLPTSVVSHPPSAVSRYLCADGIAVQRKGVGYYW